MILALALAGAAGCHKSASQTCIKGCEKTVSCLGGTAQGITDCENQSDCAHQDDNPGNCTDDSFHAFWDCDDQCLDQDCLHYAQCIAACPKCVHQ
jgi:hypothetical protein